MVTHSQYDVEDIPPAEASVDLYQQARQAVYDAPAKADDLHEKSRVVLGELWDYFEAIGDQPSLHTINAIFERSQSMVQIIAQQAQALAGADFAIDELKAQRETLAHELNDLIRAIESVDPDHAKIAPLATKLKEAIEEIESEWATQVVYESFYANLVPIIKQINPHANAYKRVDWFLQFLKGDRLMTDEQRHLVTALFQTMGN